MGEPCDRRGRAYGTCSLSFDDYALANDLTIWRVIDTVRIGISLSALSCRAAAYLSGFVKATSIALCN
jgi:hypothetical protein